MMTVFVAGSMFYSCETTELEDLASPNALSPDLASADLLLNSIQLNYLGAMQGMQGNGAALGRISYMFGRDYYNNFSSGTASGAWGALYSGILPDLDAIVLQNDDGLLDFHIGISQTMAAHIMFSLVDSVGDVPWTEANNPAEYSNPSVDADEDVYEAAMAMLDSAESYLATAGGGDDLFYGGDVANWMKLVNTLRFRYHLTVGTDPNVILDFITSNPIISTADADLQFNYGDQELQPDTRHPWYISDYTTSGANIYKSNWLMDVMTGDQNEWKGLFGTLPVPAVGEDEDGTVQRAVMSDDPRRRYYFYRQNRTTPGQASLIWGLGQGPWVWPEDVVGTADPTLTENPETLTCSTQQQPIHVFGTEEGSIAAGGYVGRWCSSFLGYWGRAHGNNEGTPPDNFTRTAIGVYPAGGSFDNMPDVGNWDTHVSDWDGTLGGFEEGLDDLNEADRGGVWLGNGGGGAGIWPIYLSSYVHFMVAETQLAAGDAAGAAASMRTAMEHSFAKVTSFASLDAEADADYLATATEISDFIDMKVAEFENAPATVAYSETNPSANKDQLDVLGEQYFVAMFGGANDAWNFIRRTGHPRHLAKGIMDDSESGPFPRTGTYPSGEISANPNILQRQDNATLVFWDNGVLNPAN